MADEQPLNPGGHPDVVRTNEPWFHPPNIAVDCLYNSSRNVVVSMITFAFVVTCATTLVVFSMQTTTTKNVAITFDTPPPASAFLGLPMTNFSVKVQKGPHREPLEGVRVSVSMFALQTIQLTASVPGATTFDVTQINCISNVYGTEPLEKTTNDLLCNTTAFLVGAEATTDASGVARFLELRLTHGYPSNYVIVVRHSAPMEASDNSPRTVKAVVGLKAPAFRLGSGWLTNATRRAGALQTVTIRTNVTFDGRVYDNAPESAFSKAWDSFTGYLSNPERASTGAAPSTLQRNNATVHTLSPAGIAAAQGLWLDAVVLPLNLQGKNVEDYLGNDLLVGTASPVPRVARLANNVGRVTNVVAVPNSTSFQGDLAITFDVTASVAPNAFVGLYLFGSLIPLAMPPSALGLPLTAAQMRSLIPRYVVTPVPLVRMTETVNITIDVSTLPADGNLTVTVRHTAVAGMTSPTAREGFVLFVPVRGSASAAGYQTQRSNIVSPLRLLAPTFAVALGGTATVTTGMSASGVAGLYMVLVSVDGTVSNSISVNITSIVSGPHCVVQVDSDPWRTDNRNSSDWVEIATEPWFRLMKVRVMSAANAPLVGKEAVLRADGQVPVVFLATTSGRDGWLRFTYVNVPVLPASGVQTFSIEVDGVFVRRISVNLLQAAAREGCTVLPVSLPTQQVLAGERVAPMNFEVRRANGQPVRSRAFEVQVDIAAPAMFAVPQFSRLQNRTVPRESGRAMRFPVTNGTIPFGDVRIIGVAASSYVNLYFKCVPAMNETEFSDEEAPLGDSVNDPASFTTDIEGGEQYQTPVTPVSLLIRNRADDVRPLQRVATCTPMPLRVSLRRCVFQLNLVVDWTVVRSGFSIQPTIIAAPSSYQRMYSDFSAFDLMQFETLPAAPGSSTITVTALLTPSIDGAFLIMASVDGVVFPSSGVIIDSVTPVAAIEIVRGTNFGNPVQLGRGSVVNSPVLRVLDAAGLPLQYAVVFAYLEVDGRRADISALQNLDYGAIVNFPTAEGGFMPLSTHSDAAGTVRFPNLGLAGVKPDVSFNVVFSVSDRVTVRDSASYTYAEDIFAVVTGAPSVAVPGVAMTPFTVSQEYLPGLTVAQLRVTQQNGPAVELSGPQIFGNIEASLKMSGLAMPHTALPGTYSGKVLVAGGVSVPFTFTVDGKPSEIKVVKQPPADVVLGSIFYPEVLVTASGQPVPNIPVQVSPVFSTPCTSGEHCGVLSGELVVMTDKRGYASFALAFDKGQQGAYTLTFTVSGTDATAVDAFLANVQLRARDFLGERLRVESIPSMFSSSGAVTAPALLASLLPDPDRRTTSSNTMNVFNPIMAVQIVRSPSLHASTDDLPRGLDVQPIVRLVDWQSQPVANTSVEIITPGYRLAKRTIVSSDANGTITFADLVVEQADVGTHAMVFSARGVRSPGTGQLAISAPPAASMDTQMKIISFAVIAILLPLLVANIPYSSWRWLPVSLISLGVVVGFAILEFSSFLHAAADGGSIYITAYIGMMVVLFALMAAAVFVLLVQHARKCTAKEKAAVDIDDEDRMSHFYRYAQWISTARRDMSWTHGKQRAAMNVEIKQSMAYRFQEWCHAHKLTFVDLKSLVKFTDDVSLPPLEPPPEIKTVFIPLKFWIVMAITLVLLALVIIFSAYSVDRMREFGMNLLQLLPRPPPDSIGNWDKISSQAVNELTLYVAKAVPQLAFITEVMRPMTKFNLFAFAYDVSIAVEQIINALPIALLVAHIFAAASVFSIAIVMYVRIPDLIVRARRGEFQPLYDELDVNKADEYIGIHCLLFMLQHQLVFWIFFIVTTVIACKFSRDYLLAQLLSITVVLTFGLAAFQELLQGTVVKLFVVDGMVVFRPLLNSLYSVYAAVMGVFSGLIGCVVRTATAIGCIIFMSPMLEYSIIPGPLSVIDAGYIKFMSMIVADMQYNNPIMLAALSVFIVDTRIAVAARRCAKEPGTIIVFDRDSFGKHQGVASIVNMVRQRFDHLCRDYARRTGTRYELGAQAPAVGLCNVRYARIANRWWLLYLLHRNPTLRRYRKQRIWEENAVAPPTPAPKQRQPPARRGPAEQCPQPPPVLIRASYSPVDEELGVRTAPPPQNNDSFALLGASPIVFREQTRHAAGYEDDEDVNL